MNDEIKEALRRFNREDLIDDGYEHNDLDTGITVSLTLKQMIKYNQLQSNWNSLREWLIEAEEKSWNDYYNAIVDVLDKMNELEGKDNDGK